MVHDQRRSQSDRERRAHPGDIFGFILAEVPASRLARERQRTPARAVDDQRRPKLIAKPDRPQDLAPMLAIPKLPVGGRHQASDRRSPPRQLGERVHGAFAVLDLEEAGRALLRITLTDAARYHQRRRVDRADAPRLARDRPAKRGHHLPLQGAGNKARVAQAQDPLPDQIRRIPADPHWPILRAPPADRNITFLVFRARSSWLRLAASSVNDQEVTEMTTPSQSPPPAEQAIRDPASICERFCRACNADDIEQLLALYEPGAVIVERTGELSRGTAAVREHLSKLLAMRPKMHILSSKTVIAGDLAQDTHHWRCDATAPDGTAIQLESHGADLLRRQGDGSWRVVIDNPWGAPAGPRLIGEEEHSNEPSIERSSPPGGR
jgi:uncharacterized protein (TIGR02246 family)